MLHEPTGATAEATERRSQAANRSVALRRLRFRLACEIRTPSVLDDAAPELEEMVRKKFTGTPLRVNDENDDKPAVLALVLNDLHASGGQPSLVAPCWNTTTTAIVRLIRSHPTAFQLLNQIRQHHGRGPLK